MYRCQICDAVSAPGEPMQRYIVRRKDGQIAKEIPGCQRCLMLIMAGIETLNSIWTKNHPKPKTSANAVTKVAMAGHSILKGVSSNAEVKRQEQDQEAWTEGQGPGGNAGRQGTR